MASEVICKPSQATSNPGHRHHNGFRTEGCGLLSVVWLASGWSAAVGVPHQAPPVSVIGRTTARPLRADTERSFSSNVQYLRAGGWLETAFGFPIRQMLKRASAAPVTAKAFADRGSCLPRLLPAERWVR
jgi:hypothetical protein